MDAVTHILTGACLSRAGLNRRAAYATLTLAIAAEFPDIDILWRIRGPVAAFQHHRGITHTFLAVPVEAAFLVAAVWLLHRFRVRRHAAGKDANKAITTVPVRWEWLFFGAILALLSHLLLDYTNTYGLRPFLPMNPRWYAGSIFFIFDPLFFTVLILAVVVLPPLFRLIGSEVGARSKFPSSGWSISAMTLLVVYGSLRVVNHARAQQLAEGETFASVAAQASTSAQFASPRAVEVGPDPFDPFLWHAVLDCGETVQQADVHLQTGSVTRLQQTYSKPERSLALIAAEASPLGRVYMDWSPIPIITVSRPGDAGRVLPSEAKSEQNTFVTFRDPRFMLDIPVLRSRSNPPLTAVIELDPANRVVRQSLDESEQR